MEKTSQAIATFGSGCFWCTEAVFQRLKGVISVTSGYAGGTTENPTYEAVASRKTGHAEVTQIVFDSGVISYRDLLEVLFATHDPTTLNRQGNDSGPEYRSIILYSNDEQKKAAEDIIHELTEGKVFSNPIVSEVKPLGEFFPAEKYHQNYYNSNTNQGYCQFVIAPKLAKFKAKFASLLKDEEK